MRVTLIADASFCNDHKVAGYGYWVASDRGREGGGGEMQGVVGNNVVAEMMAVCLALFHGLKKGLVQEGDEVLLQTDCLPAIDALSGKRTKLITQEREVVDKVLEYKKRFSLQLEYRHVKGHTNRPGNRYITNRLCDQRAKEAMRRARAKKYLQHIREVLKNEQ